MDRVRDDRRKEIEQVVSCAVCFSCVGFDREESPVSGRSHPRVRGGPANSTKKKRAGETGIKHQLGGESYNRQHAISIFNSPSSRTREEPVSARCPRRRRVA